MSRALTQADKVAAFTVATSGLPWRFEPDPIPSMDDSELTATLAASMSIAGGRGGPKQMHVSWQSAGLKIWASWHIHNVVTERPIFEGMATVRMAREVYAIAEPAQPQLSLF